MKQITRLLTVILGGVLAFYTLRWEWFGFSWNIVSTLSIILVICFHFSQFSKQNIFPMLKHPISLLFLAYLILGAWQSDWSIQAIGIALYAHLFPWLVSIIIVREKSLKKSFQKGLIIGGLGIAILAISQVIINIGVEYRPTAIYNLGLDQGLASGGFANYIGMYLLLIFVYSLFTKNQYPVIIKTLLLLGILSSQSLIATFSLLVISIWYYFYWKKSKTSLTIIQKSLILIIILVFFVWQFPSQKIQNLTDMTQRNSITTRIQIWDVSLSLISDNWWQGLGLDGYQEAYTKAVPNQYFPPLEWLVPHPHNIILFIWSEGGILAIFWIILVFRLLQNSLRLKQKEGLILATFFILGIFDTPLGRIDTNYIWWFALSSLVYYQITKSSIVIKEDQQRV